MLSGCIKYLIPAAVLLLGLQAIPASAEDASPGFETAVALTTDILDNTKGGLKTGTRDMYNVDLTAHWTGAHGWSAFGYVLVNAQGGFTANYVGDAQTISNIDAVPGTRLFEVYVRHSDDRLTATFGLINLNSIFDTQSIGAIFLDASHGIGPDYSQSGPPIFPVSALGMVGDWQFQGGTLHLRGGLFDGQPGNPNNGSVFASLHLSASEGAHYVFEAEKQFPNGFVKLGHWGYTVAGERIDGIISGFGGHSQRNGTYAQAGMKLSHEKADDAQGLNGWVRAGVANRTVFDIANYMGGGLVYTGAITGRDHDQLGMAVARATYGHPARMADSNLLDAETTYELTYQAQLTPVIMVQPDIQYVHQPSGQRGVADALVVGVRLRFSTP